MPSAQIIAIGSEMLTPEKVDTNSLFITRELNRLGITLSGKRIVGDTKEEIAEAIQQCFARADIVIVSGGLGPTEDDLTREGAAMALDKTLVYREEILEAIAERFRRTGRQIAERNRRQAFVLEGARVLPNPNGTAPGQVVTVEGGKLLFLLPGPPRELEPMVQEECVPIWATFFPGRFLRTHILRIARMSESAVDELAAPVYTQFTNPETTILASAGDISLQFRASTQSEAEAERLLAEVVDPIRKILGRRIYSEDGSSLETTVVRILTERKQTVALAESCTAGFVSARLAAAPGASVCLLGGFVVYTDEIKTELTGVDPQLIAAHTAVSAEVAEALAANTQQRTGSDYAISLTGFAGPMGGNEKDPVGTVYFGLATPNRVLTKRQIFVGDRGHVVRLASQWALDLLRTELVAPDQNDG